MCSRRLYIICMSLFAKPALAPFKLWRTSPFASLAKGPTCRLKSVTCPAPVFLYVATISVMPFPGPAPPHHHHHPCWPKHGKACDSRCNSGRGSTCSMPTCHLRQLLGWGFHPRPSIHYTITSQLMQGTRLDGFAGACLCCRTPSLQYTLLGPHGPRT